MSSNSSPSSFTSFVFFFPFSTDRNSWLLFCGEEGTGSTRLGEFVLLVSIFLRGWFRGRFRDEEVEDEEAEEVAVGSFRACLLVVGLLKLDAAACSGGSFVVIVAVAAAAVILASSSREMATPLSLSVDDWAGNGNAAGGNKVSISMGVVVVSSMGVAVWVGAGTGAGANAAMAESTWDRMPRRKRPSWANWRSAVSWVNALHRAKRYLWLVSGFSCLFLRLARGRRLCL